jgi:hypothetical protein
MAGGSKKMSGCDSKGGRSRQSTGICRAEELFCRTHRSGRFETWRYTFVTYVGRTVARVTIDVNHGLWVTVLCQHSSLIATESPPSCTASVPGSLCICGLCDTRSCCEHKTLNFIN